MDYKRYIVGTLESLQNYFPYYKGDDIVTLNNGESIYEINFKDETEIQKIETTNFKVFIHPEILEYINNELL